MQIGVTIVAAFARLVHVIVLLEAFKGICLRSRFFILLLRGTGGPGAFPVPPAIRWLGGVIRLGDDHNCSILVCDSWGLLVSKIYHTILHLVLDG